MHARLSALATAASIQFVLIIDSSDREVLALLTQQRGSMIEINPPPLSPMHHRAAWRFRNAPS